MGWFIFEEEASLHNFLPEVEAIHEYFIGVVDIGLLLDHSGQYLPKMHLANHLHYLPKTNTASINKVEVFLQDVLDGMPLE